MPITILSAQELALRRARAGAHAEYVDALTSMQVGQGAEVDVAAEGVSRQMVKNRLSKAAESLGVSIKYLRSDSNTVVFELLGAPEEKPRRRGRQPKNPPVDQ